MSQFVEIAEQTFGANFVGDIYHGLDSYFLTAKPLPVIETQPHLRVAHFLIASAKPHDTTPPALIEAHHDSSHNPDMACFNSSAYRVVMYRQTGVIAVNNVVLHPHPHPYRTHT